jgi:hypothetical protein
VGSAVRTWLDRDVQSTGGSGWPDAWAEVTPPAMNHDTAVTTALDASGRVWVLTPIRTAAGTDDIVFAAQLMPGRWS